MPKKQSPLTKKMILNIIKQTKDHHLDSKERAFADWCILGLHMAYRCIEWCNKWNPKNLEDFHWAKDINKSIYQCLVEDFQLLGQDGIFLPEDAQLLYNPGLLSHVKVKVCFQKNGRNGEILTVAANIQQQPTFSGTRAAQRIKNWAHRLGLDPHQPASAYRSNPGAKPRAKPGIRTTDRPPRGGHSRHPNSQHTCLQAKSNIRFLRQLARLAGFPTIAH